MQAAAPHHEASGDDLPPCEQGGGCPKAAARGSEPTALAATAFRMVEKKYKLYKHDLNAKAKHRREIPADDFSEVVDFHDIANNTDANQSMIREVRPPCPAAGLCYTFVGVPGLLFFPNAVSVADQQRWAQSAIDEYSQSRMYPNNLSTLNPTAVTSSYTPAMRWATLGFKYNWTTRTYDKKQYALFPAPLNELMCRLVNGVAGVTQDEFLVNGLYQSQTAIVNYFPVGSMMMAHQDVSEVCLEKPLMSMSLGCSAVFLMGTDRRDDKPHAFFLRSGDVVAFTGPSRVAYHAVPRILDDCPDYLLPSEASPDTWRTHMPQLRININVRQVYDEACDFLFSEPQHCAEVH